MNLHSLGVGLVLVVISCIYLFNRDHLNIPVDRFCLNCVITQNQFKIVSRYHVLVLFSHKCYTFSVFKTEIGEYISRHVDIQGKTSFFDAVVYQIV